MPHEWVLHVLADLKSFSQRAGLHRLVAQLDETRRVAEEEIAGAADAGTNDFPPFGPQGGIPGPRRDD